MMYGLDSRNRIDLSTYQEIKTQTSSKGNQSKFYQQGYWVKLDFMGYESLAEVIASELIQLTNISPELHLPYGLGIYERDGQQQMCCVSPNFIAPNEELVTLHRLFTIYRGTQYIHTFDDTSTTSLIQMLFRLCMVLHFA